MKFFTALAALPLALAAPVIRPREAELIPGKFIAVFKPTSGFSALDTNSVISALDTEPETQFAINDFKGISFSGDDAKAQAIADHPDVSSLE